MRAPQSVEAARECGMRAVVVAGRKPLYEMGAADLVVRGLDELSFINLKQLFSDEDTVRSAVRALLWQGTRVMHTFAQHSACAAPLLQS